MADSFIQLPADSTGKQLDTALVNMGVGTTAVHREKVVVADPLSTSAFAVVTSSQGLQVSSTQSHSILGTVTVVSASSGLVQVSGIPTVVVASSAGLTQTVTILSASSGLVQISGTPTVTATAATNPWASAPSFNIPTVSVSSGLVQISGTPVVTATAATNPWSSVPGFNIPVVNVSSGLIQISGTPAVTSTFILATPASTGGAVGPVTSSLGVLGNLTTAKIVPVLAASSGLISIDLWQGTSSITPSYVIATTISKVSTSPGSLWSLHAFTTAPTGGIIRFYNAGTSSVDGNMNTSVVASFLVGAQSTVAMQPIHYSLPPVGIGFTTQCSFDVVVTATSTSAVAGTTYVTLTYSTV